MRRHLVSTPAGWWAVAIGSALAATAAVASAAQLPPMLALIPLACAAIVVLIARLRGMRALPVVFILFAAAVGIARGTLGTAHSVLERAVHSGTVAVTGTVREGTGARRSANQIVIDVDHAVMADGEVEVHGGVLATLRTAPRLLPGDRVELDATGLRAPRSTGAEAALPRDGVIAVAESATANLLAEGGPSPSRALAQVRLRLAAAVDAALPEPASSLVNSLTFALPASLPPDLTTALRDSGLSHLLATSGLKVVLIAGLMGALLNALAAPPRLRFALMALAVGAYIVLCGASPAAIRSAVMAATGWALYGTGRSADPLPLLVAVAAAMLLVAPDLARDVGFQLTFLGTLGILLFASPIAERLPGPRLLREPFALTLAASAVTLPVMASTFGVISLVGPLANAIAVPLLAPLLVCGGLGAGIATIAPGLGFVPQVAGALARMIATIAQWCAGLPVAAVHVQNWPPALSIAELAALAAGGLVWHGLRRRVDAPLLPRLLGRAERTTKPGHSTGATARPRRRINRPVAVALSALTATLAGSAVVFAANRPDGRMHVSVLDVGAARAALVQTSTGDRALVDTGSDPKTLLDSLGPALPPLTRSVEMLVLTAGDRTGAGGLPGLTDRYTVSHAVALAGLPATARNGLSTLADRGTQVTTLDGDAAWTWGGATWRLVSAPGTSQPAAALLVADPTGTALFLGNLDAAAQEELAGLDAGSLHADLLVTPPGGAVAPALLAAVHPTSIAVPSAHGRRTTSTTLVAGPGVRRTGDSGTLTYAGGDGGLTPT